MKVPSARRRSSTIQIPASYLDVRRQSPIDGGVGVGYILLPQGRVLAPSQGTQGAGVNILGVTLPAKYIRVFYKHKLHLGKQARRVFLSAAQT